LERRKKNPSEMTVAHDRELDSHDRLVEHLFEAHANAVLRYCVLALGNTAEAEDAVSETFARLLKSPRRPDHVRVTGDADRAWVFGIARNVVREHRRWVRRHPRISLETQAFEDPSSPNLDELAGAKEELEELQRALNGLRDDYRQVLLLRFAAGLTSEEAGQVLGKSAGAVRIQQLRALEQLRQQLNQPFDI
jgi:RNA polymerase sigma-70 factor, ECF subfamily